MDKVIKISLILIGVLLFLNGMLNIVDDGRVLTYDIASVLSGIGFVILGISKRA